MKDLTTTYAQIVKTDKNSDGTLTVYGKATDDSLDIDQQIADDAWLSRAMPEWFMTGGNIREQHSNIAAGVAKEYEAKSDGHYISALVVDPVSVKKVETGVLKGFSIGIRAPRVVRDTKAVNGRIIDGQIVEVSLVDRPANPNCQLVLAKSIEGETSLVKVEELVETTIEKEMHETETPMNGEAKSIPSREEMMERYAMAKKAFDECKSMCKEYGYEDIEKQYGETAEEESIEGPAGSGAEHELGEAKKEIVVEDNSMADKSLDGHKCLECGCNVPQSTHGLTQVPAAGGTPANEMANVSTATMISPTETPKSVDTIVPPASIEVLPSVTEETIEEFVEAEPSTSKSLLADTDLTGIIEKAVKSAMKSVEEEVALLKSAKEAVENKATELETELATAKSLARGGGPKRSVIATGEKQLSEWKSKADHYMAKANSTTDQILAKGYREMAKDFLAKASAPAESK
jgi:hypothetical protein